MRSQNNRSALLGLLRISAQEVSLSLTFFLFLGYFLFPATLQGQIFNNDHQCITLSDELDRVEVGDVNNFRTQNFTIECWASSLAKVTSGLGYTAYNLLGRSESIDPSGNTPGERGYGLYIIDGTTAAEDLSVFFAFIISDGNESVVLKYPIGATDTDWYHVAGVREGRKVTLYINGEPVASETSRNIINVNSDQELTIGGETDVAPNQSNSSFVRFIDEVRLWNKARSAKEINETLSCAVIQPRLNLVGSYNFDNAFIALSQAQDISCYGNNGTIIGAARVNSPVANAFCSPERITEVRCGSLYWPPSGRTYHSSGVYGERDFNDNGCEVGILLDFTNNGTPNNTRTEILCNNETFTWSENGVTYDRFDAGTYSVSYVNSRGCTYFRYLKIIDGATPNTTDRVNTLHNSYRWPVNNQCYYQSGTYKITATNEFGCPYEATLALNLNPIPADNVTLCDEPSYTWPENNVTYTASGTYRARYTSFKTGCDSVHTLNLVLGHSDAVEKNVTACDRYFWPSSGRNYNNSGTYTASFLNRFGCDSTETLNLTINKSQFVNITEAACNEYRWSANNQLYTESGFYTTTIPSSQNCDSTIRLSLFIYRDKTYTDDIHLCDQTEYTWPVNGITYYQNTVVEEHFTSQFGCDSIHRLELDFNFSNTGVEEVVACDRYYWKTTRRVYTESGIYTGVLTNKDNCDSVVTLNLVINPVHEQNQTVFACEDSYYWSANGQTYTEDGTYTATLQNQFGCDSIIRMELTFKEPDNLEQEVTACGSYYWDSTEETYETSGSYKATFTNQFGCDSTITLRLTINPIHRNTQTITGCDQYLWPETGETYLESGTYQKVYTSRLGCDSILELVLTVEPTQELVNTIVECGPSYFWDETGITYSQSGNYSKVYQSATGCDSVRTLVLTVDATQRITEQIAQCTPYLWDETNETYNRTGKYEKAYPGSNGCDSIRILDLTILSDSVPFTVSACNQYFWEETGLTYTNSGQYFQTYTNRFNCDSVHVLNLTINASPRDTTVVSACDQYFWPQSQQTYTTTGLYRDTTSNAAGCYTVHLLDLQIRNSDRVTEEIVACDFYTWPVTGIRYENSGRYTGTLTNRAGCDSVIIIDLTLLNSDRYTVFETACDSFYWDATETWLSQSGQYSATLQNNVGCDSIIDLDLSLRYSNNIPTQVTSCDRYFWTETGSFYYESGEYTSTYTNALGCDSVHTLELTILPVFKQTEPVVACETYTWSQNGTTYTKSTLDSVVYTRANGCDSIYILDLTINQPYFEEIERTYCNTYTWPATGNTYTQSGIYTADLSTQSGCDSTLTLDLTILPTTYGQEQRTECGESYYWPEGFKTLTSSGSYSAVIAGENGCDSVVTLDLTLIQLDTEVTETNDEITIAQGNDTYQWYYYEYVYSPGIFLSTERSVTPEKNGLYRAIITKDICTDTLDIQHEFHTCEQPFFIPNSFSPNGDSYNERFEITSQNCTVSDFSIKIFNRWGNMVFSATEPDFSWDGRFKNTLLNPGVYAYTIQFTTQDYQEKYGEQITGTIRLLK